MATTDQLLDAGLSHHRAGRLQLAEQLYRQVLAADRKNPDAIHLLGLVAHQRGQHEQAAALISLSIRLGADGAEHFNNLGEAYRAWGKQADAIAAYSRAIALRPNFAEAFNNLGTIHQTQGRLDAALACYDRAISLQPGYANAHYNRARAWLTSGDFSQGFREYEWRWKRAEFHRPRRSQPEWDGSPLAGRTLLVQAEQGLGDTLQFIRFVECVDSPMEKLLIEVQPALLALLTQSGFRNLIPQGSSLPAFDIHTEMLSLPRWLGTTLETIPARIPYLRANLGLVDTWRSRLPQGSSMMVGIHWQGFQNSPLEPWRSIPLAAFQPLAKLPGVRLISLQKGFGAERISRHAEKLAVLDLGSELDEVHGPFMDTAAVIEHLDLVITSDSAVAHLAGALGARVWVVLPMAADWRWMQQRRDSPWYPSMRLFRQAEQGDWSGVLSEVAAELAALIDSRGA